jgi:amino acid transporter
MSPALSVSPPTAPTLQRTVTWKSSFVVSLGASLLVATALGSIAADLGPASVFVWTTIVVVGILQCLMIAEMASMFPDKSGGTATYTHEAFKKYPFIGAMANWGYWCGWVPVIPVNLIVAAGYLKSFAPHLTDNNVLVIAIVMALALYALNWIGLKPGIWSSTIMAVCAIGPMAVIILSPVFLPHIFHAANLFPFVPLGGSWHSHASWMLIFKDMFVALWSAYAIESASTTIAELRDPHKDAPKAITAASIGGFFAYGVLPFVLLGIVGVSVLSQDASVAFLPAAQAIFGHVGGIVVSIMLITALLLGVQTTIIGSSRSVYQMSHDGQMIKQFGTINKFGVPVGSMAVDLVTTIGLLVVFKNNIISLIAASNVGYLLVFLLLIPAYIILRLTQPGVVRSFKLPSIFVGIAALITAFNVFLFTVGGFQWGKAIWIPGTVIMLLFIPFYLYRRLVQDKRPGALAYAATPLTELKEGQDDLGGRREVVHSEKNEGHRRE